jgi:hypothetical protein
MNRGYGQRGPVAPPLSEFQALCQRARLAGAPGGPARSTLVTEYHRLALAIGLTPQPVETGAELQQVTVVLLRHASAARRAVEAAKLVPSQVRRAGSL